MAFVAYETLQAIREEAGLQHTYEGEALDGTADGSNKEFYVKRKPIVDRNDDDSVTIADVTVYDDGISVSIASIDAATGRVTLVNAPAANSVMTVDYATSPASDTYVGKLREEAQEMVDEKMSELVSTPYTTVPKRVRKITRWCAAANMLVRDYGNSVDTEQTSKDGYFRRKECEAMLEKYYQDIRNTVAGTGSARAKSDGDLFRRRNDDDERVPSGEPSVVDYDGQGPGDNIKDESDIRF